MQPRVRHRERLGDQHHIPLLSEEQEVELERPWRVILLKPMNALRHRQHNVY